jgi:hypothetical protein
MKTEMKMLPNGNYEAVICPIQHECYSEGCTLRCVHYSWKEGLHLEIGDGDPCEDGYCNEFIVKYCPFCGYCPH